MAWTRPRSTAEAKQGSLTPSRVICMLPSNPIDTVLEPTIDLPMRAEEIDRIEDLLRRYDGVLSEADTLNDRIESLLKEWNESRSDPS